MNTQDTELAETSLRESADSFRSLFETMAQGVIYQNAQGEIIAANPAAQRILGLTLDQLQGRTTHDTRWRPVHEDGSDFPRETQPAMVALRTGQPVHNVVIGAYAPAEDRLAMTEAGKLELHLTAVPVDELCRASLLFVREMAVKKEIHVEYANASPGVQITADEQRLKQMLVNLLSNAVKFTSGGGHVRLGITMEPDGLSAGLIHFAVQDDGPGIAPADQARLFQPFIQLDAQLSRQHEGTGLGLALVKRLAEQHGGSVRLDSTGIPGEGCCFTITLPTRMLSIPC